MNDGRNNDVYTLISGAARFWAKIRPITCFVGARLVKGLGLRFVVGGRWPGLKKKRKGVGKPNKMGDFC